VLCKRLYAILCVCMCVCVMYVRDMLMYTPKHCSSTGRLLVAGSACARPGPAVCTCIRSKPAAKHTPTLSSFIEKTTNRASGHGLRMWCAHLARASHHFKHTLSHIRRHTNIRHAIFRRPPAAAAAGVSAPRPLWYLQVIEHCIQGPACGTSTLP